MKRLAAVLALVLSSYVLAPALVAPANADDYAKGVRTSCHIAVPAVVRAKQSPRVTITVQPNAPDQAAAAKAVRPSGTVELTILRGGTGIFTKTVKYSGRPVTVVGPVLREPGHYVVRATFRTADGTVFKSCHNNDAFNVKAGSSPDVVGPHPNPGNTNPGGLLPDTGGPDMFWLVLALVLVGSGGALVYASKRRPRAPLYDV